MGHDRNEIADLVREKLGKNGKKWSSTHRLAIDEILDVIDEEVLHVNETRLSLKENELNAFDSNLRLKEIAISATQRQADTLLEQVKSEKNNLMALDERGQNAYKLACVLKELYKGMDPDLMKCVSYGVWAYLSGDKYPNDDLLKNC